MFLNISMQANIQERTDRMKQTYGPTQDCDTIELSLAEEEKDLCLTVLG